MNIFNLRTWRQGLTGMLFAMVAVPVLAASEMPDFKAYDSNGDGTISMDEFVAQGGKSKDFIAADANGDNVLSVDEFSKSHGMSDKKESKGKY